MGMSSNNADKQKNLEKLGWITSEWRGMLSTIINKRWWLWMPLPMLSDACLAVTIQLSTSWTKYPQVILNYNSNNQLNSNNQTGGDKNPICLFSYYVET
jgi:hypothetical protein